MANMMTPEHKATNDSHRQNFDRIFPNAYVHPKFRKPIAPQQVHHLGDPVFYDGRPLLTDGFELFTIEEEETQDGQSNTITSRE